MNDPDQELVTLLRQAAQEMMGYGPGSYLGRYDTCEQLGRFIDQAASGLEKGDKTHMAELWSIFAPTCDWDDAGGSLELGDAIFSRLDSSAP